jgi:hypothetical protein
MVGKFSRKFKEYSIKTLFITGMISLAYAGSRQYQKNLEEYHRVQDSINFYRPSSNANSATYESLEWRLEHDSAALMKELEAKKPKDLRTEDHEYLNKSKYNSKGRFE